MAGMTPDGQDEECGGEIYEDSARETVDTRYNRMLA
jgi:hypothetical protein